MKKTPQELVDQLQELVIEAEGEKHKITDWEYVKKFLHPNHNQLWD